MTRLAATVAAPLLEDRVTETPPAPAGAARVTVPVEGEPPVTEVGFSVTLPIVAVVGEGGFKVRLAEALFADVAVIVTVVGELTEVVVTVKVPLD